MALEYTPKVSLGEIKFNTKPMEVLQLLGEPPEVHIEDDDLVLGNIVHEDEVEKETGFFARIKGMFSQPEELLKTKKPLPELIKLLKDDSRLNQEFSEETSIDLIYDDMTPSYEKEGDNFVLIHIIVEEECPIIYKGKNLFELNKEEILKHCDSEYYYFYYSEEEDEQIEFKDISELKGTREETGYFLTFEALGIMVQYDYRFEKIQNITLMADSF